jgi:hypothetical protein
MSKNWVIGQLSIILYNDEIFLSKGYGNRYSIEDVSILPCILSRSESVCEAVLKFC